MAKKQKCMIIGAAPIDGKTLFSKYDLEDYYIICADGGYETAEENGITPDLIVGDFDSAKKKPGKTNKTLILPVEKDVTDTMFAAIKGQAKGFRSFVFLGCLGGERVDHTFANLEVLHYLLEHGAQGVLADEHTQLMLLKNNRLRLSKMKGTTVSVFPYAGNACTVTYDGLQYPLNHETLNTGGFVMGVSNSVVKDEAEIKIHTGIALVALYQP